MSYGRPVLATKVGGIGEVMKDGKTGYLFGLGETEKFAEKIIALSQDKILTVELGHNALQVAHSGFCADKIVEEYVEYYREIMKTC